MILALPFRQRPYSQSSIFPHRISHLAAEHVHPAIVRTPEVRLFSSGVADLGRLWLKYFGSRLQHFFRNKQRHKPDSQSSKEADMRLAVIHDEIAVFIRLPLQFLTNDIAFLIRLVY
jgi:hypothetical protein